MSFKQMSSIGYLIGYGQILKKVALFASYLGFLALKSTSNSVWLDRQCLGIDIPGLDNFFNT